MLEGHHIVSLEELPLQLRMIAGERDTSLHFFSVSHRNRQPVSADLMADGVGKEIGDRMVVAHKRLPVEGKDRRDAMFHDRVDCLILLEEVPGLPLTRIRHDGCQNTGFRTLVSCKIHVRYV